VALPPYHVSTSDEDRKQLYWGAFMQGAAAVERLRSAGRDVTAVDIAGLARRVFDAILAAAASNGLPFVDDTRLGQECFVDAFVTGYRQRAFAQQEIGARGRVRRARGRAQQDA
jgi:hypothetical protein